MSSIAAETRRAVDNRPYLREALRAGVLNYTEAARQLDLEGETGAIASALRRYAEELPPFEPTERTVRVRMKRGVSRATLTVLDNRPPTTESTAITLEGDVDAALLARVLSSLTAAEVSVFGAGVVADVATILVAGPDGSRALRLVEAVVD